jgi:hypothetical protein
MPEVLDRVTVRAIGNRAAAALRACAGRVRPLPDFPTAPYCLAGAEIVWIGVAGPMHPRAIFVDALPAVDATLPTECRTWSAPVPALAAAQAARFRHLLSWHLPQLAKDAPASGLAPLLAARPPAFPLAARTDECAALCRASLAADLPGFARAAARLLGAGSGLTPSGDDFVGAALFTLRALHPGDLRWRRAAADLTELARTRTHSIGAALFADLAQGQSFAALHALFATGDPATFTESARALTAIGHSSGWDMLAGIVAASIGLPSTSQQP